MKENYKLQVYKIEDEHQEKKYTDLLQKYRDASIYYGIEHIKYFLKDQDKLKYIILEKEGVACVLMPILIRKVILDNKEYPYYDSISPYGYNGPLFTSEVADLELEIFWNKLDLWYKDNNVISEFVRFSLNQNQLNYSGILINSLLNIKGRLLGNFEEQWTSFLPKVRNNYRKAEKSNLSFKLYQKEEITNEVLDAFTKVYTNTMNRNNANSLYFFPKKYFSSLISSMPNSFGIAITYFEGTPASVELIIKNNNSIFAFLGGTESDYFSYRPNDFLRVEIIKWAIKNNMKFYILGGGIVNGDGLHKSKKAFFPKEEEAIFYTGRKIINKKVYNQLCLERNNQYKEIEEEAINNDFFPYYRKANIKD